PARFHESAEMVPILTLGFLAQSVYSLFAPEILYSKRTWLIPVVALSSASVNVVVTLCTVKAFGARGVAWAMSAGFAASALVGALFAVRLVSIPHRWRDALRSLAAA